MPTFVFVTSTSGACSVTVTVWEIEPGSRVKFSVEVSPTINSVDAIVIALNPVIVTLIS